ncbi:MAG: aminopeptidase family protein [Moraxellaceae bacterium]|jgi:Xaa-Pro aminopeptidase|nr:aminopeptidase family protein [Moraxellaceae bacterium]
MPLLSAPPAAVRGYQPDAADLEQFRHVQRLAYAAAEAVAKELKPGMTEKQAARLQEVWLLDHGVTDWFHSPFAWFGDRTAFQGFKVALQFLPTNRRLEENMPFILDNAPVVNGYVADIGYAGVLGENPILDLLLDDLAAHRALILDLIRQRQPMSEVSRAVDRLILQQGHAPRHKAYPFETLAHTVQPMPPRKRQTPTTLFKFGLQAVESLGRLGLVARRQGWSPIWSSNESSNHAPVPGLWAVEPHLGFHGVGAKFEELLVITEDDAYWLDDESPHVRRWKERGLWPVDATAGRAVA